jgi:hypothetical protein
MQPFIKKSLPLASRYFSSAKDYNLKAGIIKENIAAVPLTTQSNLSETDKENKPINFSRLATGLDLPNPYYCKARPQLIQKFIEGIQIGTITTAHPT